MRPLPLATLLVAFAAEAHAQAPSPPPAALPQSTPPAPLPPDSAGAAPVEPAAAASGQSAAPFDDEAGAPRRVFTEPGRRTGFTSGLRLGVGVPLGGAGEDVLGAERDLMDLTPWRSPVWVDLGYSLSGALTIGAYGQIGVGGSGDACVGDCDWNDLRLGAQVEVRLAPGAPLNPWLGVGLGYEWLSFRQLVTTQGVDELGAPVVSRVRSTERFSGPELMLQAGLDFQVEDALRIGPYASATLGQYLKDSYECQPADPTCPTGNSIEGTAFHSWIGVGVRGAYTP